MARGASVTEDPLPPRVRVRKALGRLRRRFAVDVYDVFTRAVPAQAGSAPGSGGAYALRWGTADDVARCDPYHTELCEKERRAGAERLKLDHRVVIGFHGDLAVFSMWVNPRNLNVPGLVKRRLRSDQWFIYKAFTSPDHRGKKLYEAGMAFVLGEMARRGLRELVGYAHTKKRVSRKGLARLDFASAGRIVQLRAPGVARTWVSRRLARHFPECVERTGVLAGLEAT